MNREVEINESLKLNNQLCFALYVCSKEIVRLYKPFLDEHHLTYTQYITLLALWEQDDISVKELGERLFLDSGTITPIVKKLEAKGIVRREVNKNDERSIRVVLTPQGQQFKYDVSDVPKKMFCTAGLPIKESLELKDNLYNILKIIEEAKHHGE